MKKLIKLALSLIPTALPVGLDEFNKFADEVIELSGLPDNDSTRFALAGIVMYLPSHEGFKPKFFFIKSLRKSAANQVASSVMIELKERQVQRAKEEQEAIKQAEQKNEATSDNGQT